MKLFVSRDSVSPENYAKARRDHPEYAALCDAEDSLKAAKNMLLKAADYNLLGLLDAHKAINAAVDAVVKRRERLEKSIYPGVEWADIMDMSALFQEVSENA